MSRDSFIKGLKKGDLLIVNGERDGAYFDNVLCTVREISSHGEIQIMPKSRNKMKGDSHVINDVFKYGWYISRRMIFPAYKEIEINGERYL